MGTYTYLNTRGDRWVAQQIDEDVKTFPPQSQPPVNNSELRMWLAMFELELRKLSSVSVYFFHCSAVIQNPLPLFITHLVIWIPGKPVPALGTSCSTQHQSQTMIHVTVFCVTVNTMSCFQNKSALAKINKDFLIVQSNGYISALTFLALLALMVLTTLSLNLFSTAPLTWLHSDFLLACLDTLLLSLFRTVLWTLCSSHHWLLTQRFSPLAPFWWNPDFGCAPFLLCVAAHFPGVGPSRLNESSSV